MVYESVTQGRSSHKATLDSVGLGWWQKRSPGWKVVKYNMRAKSYSLVYVSAARTGGEYTTGIHTPLPRARWHTLARVYLGTRIHIQYIHINPISKLGLQMCLFVTLWWFCPEQIWYHFLPHTHAHTHTYRLPSHKSPPTHTHVYEHTHSLAPPVSVFRLIWCSRLCSKHSWSARVNRSCQTWAGRLRGRGTGGCRRTPPHDSLAGTPAQSHPPEASLPPSSLSPPRWEDHLGIQEQCVKLLKKAGRNYQWVSSFWMALTHAAPLNILIL